MCFLKSGLYFYWILIVFTDILCPLLRCSIRIRISCLASLFHIVPLLPVVCYCFLACLGILDKVLSVCDINLRFNRNINVIFESTTYDVKQSARNQTILKKTLIITLNTIFQVDFIFRTTSRKRLDSKPNGILENLISVKPKLWVKIKRKSWTLVLQVWSFCLYAGMKMLISFQVSIKKIQCKWYFL